MDSNDSEAMKESEEIKDMKHAELVIMDKSKRGKAFCKKLIDIKETSEASEQANTNAIPLKETLNRGILKDPPS